MSINLQLIKKDQLTTSLWSGGKTTQLAIYPESSIYSDRNFIWRLSSAVVEVKSSDFTPLPGIERVIMILDGTLNLKHEGHYATELKPFDKDHFSGSWKTSSTGQVTDFNLMTKEGCLADLTALHINSNASVHLEKVNLNTSDDAPHMRTEAFYCVNHSVTATLQDKSFDLSSGDILIITFNRNDNINDIQFKTSGENTSDVVQASILYTV